MMMMMTAIAMHQAPNSKVARTPTLPIPPMHSVAFSSNALHPVDLIHCIAVLLGREVQSAELEW